MPTVGLEAFARESRAARDEALEMGRRGLRELAAFSHREVIRLSPVADPDAPGSGRLRASWTVARNKPDLRFAPLPPRGGQIPPPSEIDTQVALGSLVGAKGGVKLGDVIWIANGSPCVSTVNDRTSFVEQAIAATESRGEEIAEQTSRREVSGARAIERARAAASED